MGSEDKGFEPGDSPLCGTGSLCADAHGPQSATGLPDAHCHVAFMESPAAFASQAHEAGAEVLSVTVTPAEYASLTCNYGDAGGSVHTALGLHPWWVPESEDEISVLLNAFDEQLPRARLIGEVGLDFSKRREHTRAQQLRAFRHIADAAASRGAQALSLHCVGAYPEALQIIESSGCAERCRCIFHWFSGSSQQLSLAIKLGCWFSVGERMLQTKRGREYAKAIPLNRLLLETDAPAAKDPEITPPAVPYSLAQHQTELQRTLLQLAALRNIQPEKLTAIIRTNTKAALGTTRDSPSSAH